MSDEPSSKRRKLVMTYDSDKEVMANLDPNVRLQLALQCQKLRTLDKSTPLICDNIAFNTFRGYGTKINEVNYLVGVFPRDSGPEQKALSKLYDVRRAGTTTIGGPELCLRYSVNGEMKEQWDYNDGSTMAMARWRLLKHLFGYRDVPIQVRRLSILDPMITLPTRVQFQIKELEVAGDLLAVIHDTKRFMTPDSFPLEHLEFHHLSDDGVAEGNDPVVRSARKIKLWNFLQTGTLGFLKTVRHKDITVVRALYPVTEYIPLIEDLQTKKREIGSSIEFIHTWASQIEEILNLVKPHFPHRENENGDIFISTDHNSQIYISAEEDNNLKVLKFEILPAEKKIQD